MLTQKEYVKLVSSFTYRQKKMIVSYLQTLDPEEAAKLAGYSPSLARCARTKLLPRLMPAINYKLEKEKLIDCLVNKEWIVQQWLRMIEKGMAGEKIAALKELAKLYQYTKENPPFTVNNHIEKPAEVVISFTKE